MPTAPRPEAVAMATMGSVVRASLVRILAAKRAADAALRGWFGARAGYLVPSTPSRLLMNHCCAIDSTLLVIQYSTRPAGKKMNITLKASGMIHISLACIGSGGVGLSQVCTSEVAVMMTGRMNHGSGADRSWIHRIQGAWRISTDESSTQYRAMNTGI